MARHRKLRGRKLKKQRRIIIVSTVALTLLLSTGYAAFSTNISLSAKGNIKEKVITSETLTQNVEEASSTVSGLYKDITETNRYIYKGADPDNYIEFNDEIWRIYSIEPDGSIKIVKHYATTDSIPPRAFDSNDSSRKSGYCALGGYGYCNAWAATANLKSATGGNVTSFVNGGYSGAVTEDSEMLTYLNSDTSGNYYNTLSSTAKGQIQEHDWNVGPAGDYNDTYTLSQLVSSTYEGKYKWTGNIGLLTKSEYMRASSNSSCVTAKYWFDNRSFTTCKGSDYLYNSSTSWWLLSPNSDNSYGVFVAHSDGYVGDNNVFTSHANYSYGVRPALYLKSDITLKGEGTSEKPYYIDES